MDEGVADAAEPGVPRLDGGERQRGRDRGVDRIAAGIQHRNASLGGIFRLRDHHAAPARCCGLLDLPVLGCVGAGERCMWLEPTFDP